MCLHNKIIEIIILLCDFAILAFARSFISIIMIIFCGAYTDIYTHTHTIPISSCHTDIYVRWNIRHIAYSAYIIHIWPILFGGGNIFYEFLAASPITTHIYFSSSGVPTNRPCSAAHKYIKAAIECVVFDTICNVYMSKWVKTFHFVYTTASIFSYAIINQKFSNTFSSWMFVCFSFSPSVLFAPLYFLCQMFVCESF